MELSANENFELFITAGADTFLELPEIIAFPIRSTATSLFNSKSFFSEDEIAAINMALGASFGGVRAMTTTSGGGFALMAEGVSLAGMTETPIVIAEVQRPGPATGLPTRTEQSDLFFALHAGHGEFPRVVLTPGTPEQAFYLTNKAFHLSEKYLLKGSDLL